MTEEQRLEHNRLYQRAAAMVDDQILLHDRPLAPPGWWLRFRFRRALGIFDRVLELKPDNWSAMWIVGKVHQRLGDNMTAFSWLERAYQVNPSQPDVAREAALCAMDIGRADAAIIYAHRATQIEPESAGLHANLALAYLLAGRTDEAQRSIERSLALDPSDRISQRVQAMIQHFAATGQTPPRTAAGVEEYWRKNRPGAR